MSETSKGRLTTSTSAVIFSEIQLLQYAKVNPKWFFGQNETQTNIFSIFSLFKAIKELLLQVVRIVLVNLKCDNMISEDESTIQNFKIPTEWIYRGEGNCNVVLSLTKSRKILRIRKTDKPRSLIGWIIILISDLLYWYCGKCFGDETRDIKFYSMVMRPLIGSKYTSEVNQVILSRKQIRILENELCRYRPDFRKNKTLQYGRAAIFNDFAFLPADEYKYLPYKLSENVFAVEIKPKQGWRPLTEKHFPECFFCMNQYLKKEKNQIKEITKYCPEDLFSGNNVRMKSAIKSLIRSPQNNFKIFKNGVLLYGEKAHSDINYILQQMFEEYDEDNKNRLEEEFSSFIQQCLTRNLNNYDIANECPRKLFCEWNKIIQGGRNLLPEGCVLEKILSIQMLDAEGSHYYKKLLAKNKLGLEDWTYVKKLSNHLAYSDVCLKCSIMMLNDTEKNKDVELSCAPYLISATAKDCSLMVTFKKIRENISDLQMKNIMKTKYGDFLINIGVFDLYPKPLSTIRKHDKRNRAIYEAYMRSTLT